MDAALKELNRLCGLARKAEKLEKLINTTAPCELCKNFRMPSCGHICTNNSDFIFNETLVNNIEPDDSKPESKYENHMERAVRESSSRGLLGVRDRYSSNILD